MGDLIVLVLLFINVIITMAIKYNDIKHIEKIVDEIGIKVDNLCERVSKIEGHLDIK